VKPFRVVVSSNRMEWLDMNVLSRNSTQDAQEVRGVRWKIEEFHREAKQLRGREARGAHWPSRVGYDAREGRATLRMNTLGVP